MFMDKLLSTGGIIMAFGFVTLASYSAVQTVRVNNLTATNQEYSKKIVALESAQLLTEQLRKANADLTAELSALQEELKGQVGYETPLPSGIADVLRRVQSGD